MPEELLQYIWENRLFKTGNQKTIAGEPVEIIHPGQRNADSGPDFFNARIKIGDTIWAGNIEIHKKSSDWLAHNHQGNKAYDSVILHVAEIYDSPVFRGNGEEIPALQIEFDERIRENYKFLLSAKTWIACQERFHQIDPMNIKLGYHRLMVERLENKTAEILALLGQNQNNWNETFYRFLARMFGFKVNALPFEMLAKSLPLGIISKHKNNLFQVEAMLFGNAGLLNTELLGDDYFLKLRSEYSFLYKKYNLQGIESHLWKFMRLRPVNFPTIRIAQFAGLINRSEHLFSKILETENPGELKKLFNVRASEYWDTHYRFNKPSAKRKKELGEVSINTILINVVVPFLFVYGNFQQKPGLQDRALDLLETIPPEENSIVDKWESLGITVLSAYESQALLQLKNFYCTKKKCLNCQIGSKLLNQDLSV